MEHLITELIVVRQGAIVTHKEDTRKKITDYKNTLFTYNGKGSQSGYAAAFFHCKKHGFFFENQICSGGHLNSARMVADKKADIAYIDPISLAYMEKYDNFFHELRILDWTTPTPGLPYISNKNSAQETIFNAIEETINELSADIRDLLFLKGIVLISREDYLTIPNP